MSHDKAPSHPAAFFLKQELQLPAAFFLKQKIGISHDGRLPVRA
jgi:hypothetical protein